MSLLFLFYCCCTLLLATAAQGGDLDPSPTSAISILQQHNLSLQDLVHLDNQDLRDLGLKLHERIALKQMLSTTQDFAFVVSHFNSTRQWGKCLNIIVKYRYLPNASANSTGGGFLDYRQMREMALLLAEPTPSFPINIQWEAVNKELVDRIMLRYGNQITSVSSQIQVLSEMNSHIDEPGNHGSIVTRGAMIPLEQQWVNGFRYDCTKTSPPPASGVDVAKARTKQPSMN